MTIPRKIALLAVALAVVWIFVAVVRVVASIAALVLPVTAP